MSIELNTVEALYQNDDREVRIEALKTMGVMGNKDRTKKVVSLLEAEEQPEVKREGLRALRYIAEEDLNKFILPYTKDPDPIVRAESIICLFTKGGIEGIIKGEG